MNITIHSSRINTWNDFHDVFSDALGYPDFYGRNMDAWIDCMSYLDDADAGMTKVCIETGSKLSMILDETLDSFRGRCPEICEELLTCVSFVNQRRMECNEPSILEIKL